MNILIAVFRLALFICGLYILYATFVVVPRLSQMYMEYQAGLPAIVEVLMSPLGLAFATIIGVSLLGFSLYPRKKKQK